MQGEEVSSECERDYQESMRLAYDDHLPVKRPPLAPRKRGGDEFTLRSLHLWAR